MPEQSEPVWQATCCKSTDLIYSSSVSQTESSKQHLHILDFSIQSDQNGTGTEAITGIEDSTLSSQLNQTFVITDSPSSNSMIQEGDGEQAIQPSTTQRLSDVPIQVGIVLIDQISNVNHIETSKNQFVYLYCDNGQTTRLDLTLNSLENVATSGFKAMGKIINVKRFGYNLGIFCQLPSKYLQKSLYESKLGFVENEIELAAKIDRQTVINLKCLQVE